MNAARYRRTIKLPNGCTVEFDLKLGCGFECRWSPDVPKGAQARAIMPHYLRERNAFLASVGVPMMVVDA
ncbi:hypothetical protein [Tsuneonella sp. SYSU-LHT278]|uniref:hypothetical protein n=1 Tax=Tsuneonella sediminis TaxID=3416089 RepID=UPI003F78AF54